MKLVAIACQNCSAPLEVPEGANFVTCRHCDAQLAIKHTSSAAYTEVLQDIDQRTQRIENRLKNIERGSTLSDIDRQWEQDVKKFMIADKHGHKHLPTVGGSIIGGLAIVAFGILWTIMA